MRKKINISDVIIFLVVLVMGLSCLLPLWNVVALSFSDSASATANRVRFLPVNFNLNAYKKIMEDAQFWKSFMISVVRVILGTVINMLLTILMAYPLSKSKKEFRAQGIYMKLAIFAMLFPAGMIPLFMVVKDVGLMDTIWSMIIPAAVPIGNVILLMNFFRGIPKSLEEAAEIDGASPFQVLWKVMLPMSLPALATLSLFCIVGHWNDYFTAILYINRTVNYPLQTYIRQITAAFDMSKITNIELLKQYLQVSSRNLNSAKIVVSVIPLLLIYPFLQKYFVTGIVMGAVKE
ncbi:carbohydrate ABC transporter permease [Anaerocolumna aminovalerica]|jgi:putative aldouronate transport system permease protein|uniref:Putative aldouronate transport system permease protein n=1 Tax=Anaerocolumna aminovalerica TaxID=1527 RepID=A0A1I5GPE9_9FIRM|nr:carbohydrate ABC transporter permease [Anaerocolumna aminovalerica]MDU6263223.1 carbohydrate ABC transporter permease [Anaerocolumna aminovalerica]SFO37807.1 putative aldouronate transport system permease protein [Anaerocolumna aminovalerica]